MSPERTSHATSLPVRADRAPRADQPATGDTFATLLGAHADRPERAPSRRERQPADDSSARERDRGPVDRPADNRRPAPAAAPHGPAKPAAAETDSQDAAKPADDAATTAALLALGVPTPQPAPAPVEPTPVVAAGQPAPTETPQTPADVPALAAAAEPTAAAPGVQLPQDAAAPAAAPAAKPVAAHQAAAPAVSAPSEAATPAVPVDAPAETAPAAPSMDPSPADSAAQLPSLPSVPGPRAEARTQPDAPTAPDANAAVTPAPTGDASARQGDGRPAERDQAQPAAPASQPAAPAPTTRTDFSPIAAAPAPGISSAPKGAATLSQAPRAVGQLIQLASQKGVQHARLNLRPVELGGIEIRLQSTSAGVTAQVVADSPQAARLLQQASDDLKRSLASQNVELLSLDVSTSGEERRDASAADGGFGQFDEAGTRGQAGFGRPQRSAAAESDPELPAPTPGTLLELPDGVLVDVLA
jgi:flagellar hook-length control protein FliK